MGSDLGGGAQNSSTRSFERFVTEGNERTDEVATDGAMLDGGEMAMIRASAVQQRRWEVYAALQYAARFHCVVEEARL